MRDLLYLAHRIPYPPDKGEKIRSFHTLRHLAQNFRIHLGCFAADAEEMAHVAELRRLCADVFCRPLSRPAGLMRGGFSLLSGKSLTEGYFSDSRLQRWVDATFGKTGLKDMFVSCSSMAPYVMPHLEGRRSILDLIDVDSEKFAAYAQGASWPLSRLYAMEHRALADLERRAAKAFSRTFLVSPDEAQLLQRAAPVAAQNVSSFGNGVDFDFFDPSRPYASPFSGDGPPIVFVGRMDYPPNVQAVAWFADDVLPLLLARQPRAQFWIVGAGAGNDVTALARLPAVQVTGRVPDVRPFVAHAACVVAPLKIARGIQNKVLEAMAMARPVVATPEAAVGIDARIGLDLLCAGTAPALAEQVDLVVQGRFPELGANARARVQARHSWPSQLRALDQAFETAAPGA